MKIYARQVPPQYQESPLFQGEEFFPDDIAVYGTRNFSDRGPDVFKRVREALETGELLEAWEAINDNGGYFDSWAEALAALVPGEARGPYTREERKKKWPDIAWRYYRASWGSLEEDRALCDALELVTGEAWDTGTICGSCQGDWARVCYPVKNWSREALDAFETEYFNTGSEWIVHDSDVEPEGPEDIHGFSVYCHGWDVEAVKKEIAEAYGEPGADVVLYEFSGYSQIATYKEVTA